MARFLDLAALRSFVAVAESGSMTRAAERVHLTQSAVSMQIKRLEDALGQPLLERTRKPMMLTMSGEQLLSYGRRMLELNDEVWHRMTDVAYEGQLVLGAPHDVVYPHIPMVLKAFAKAYPRVRISLQSLYTHKLIDEFDAGRLDVILTTEAQPGEGAEVLEASPLTWIGAPGGTAWRQRPLPLAFETRCIFRPWVQEALDAAGIAWTMAVDSMSIRTVEATVAADFAIHAAILSTVPRELAVIDHGGLLPTLPATKIAMYVTNGQNAALARTLGAIIRAEWSGCTPEAIAA